MDVKSQRLIWIDLEMTGLNPDTDDILEIATLITDEQLRPVAEGPVLAIHHDDAVLERMDAWNQRTHGASGLIRRVRESRLRYRAAEDQTLAFLAQHVPAAVSPMCGNSICQDRRFLARHMPRLERYFHYRNLDVSTLKELSYRWYPQLPRFPKEERHEALADIRESLAELAYYRERIFRPAPLETEENGA